MHDDADLQAIAWSGIKNSFETKRLAHAYVVVGVPGGSATQFVESVLALLFCECKDDRRPCHQCPSCRRVESHKHVDTLWIEPQSKSRKILADDVRELILQVSQTSFEGGWKAGIIVSADRMNESSENALLKTLEEPPAKTILFLLTDSPQSLLPTILSRCYRITLNSRTLVEKQTLWREPLKELLYALPPQSGLDAAHMAIKLKQVLEKVKKSISSHVEEEVDAVSDSMDVKKLKDVLAARTNAGLKEVQSLLFKEMLDWYRDLLVLAMGSDQEHLIYIDDLDAMRHQLRLHDQSSLLAAISVVEEMARRLDRNIPDLHIFDEAFRKLIRLHKLQ